MKVWHSHMTFCAFSSWGLGLLSFVFWVQIVLQQWVANHSKPMIKVAPDCFNLTARCMCCPWHDCIQNEGLGQQAMGQKQHLLPEAPYKTAMWFKRSSAQPMCPQQAVCQNANVVRVAFLWHDNDTLHICGEFPDLCEDKMWLSYKCMLANHSHWQCCWD